MIQTLCYLLETLLTPDNTPPDTAKDIYELYFVFATIWAFGGFLFKDEVSTISLLRYIIHLC
jgi:dynein heavy chain